jgi:2'-hydroxyisoflavone reductase
MQILILGGGVFIGAATLDAALARGHRVTVFNRGRSRAAWPAAVEAIAGDRVTDLDRLAGRRWDAVIDVCGYVPADVQASAAALRDACDAYLFVSSVSAYADLATPRTAEDHPLASSEGIARDDRDPAHYGAQKAACEAEVQRAFGDRALVVRPGLVVGPGDPTGRFSHWPWRTAAGGEMLVPDVPDGTALQFIDVRDLAAWLVHALETGARGAFNASGPAGGAPIGWRALIDTCVGEAAAAGFTPAAPCRVGEAFLLEHGVQPWSELPVWLPSIDPQYAGFVRDVSRAAAAGLVTRPLRDTVRAVLAEAALADGDKRRAGKLTRAREAELLAAWRASSNRSPAPP